MFANFDTHTLVTIQDLLIPVIKSFTGFDAGAFAAGKAEMFNLVADGFGDLSMLFTLIATALEDGRLTVEEINAIVTQAKTLPVAIDAIASALNGSAPVAGEVA